MRRAPVVALLLAACVPAVQPQPTLTPTEELSPADVKSAIEASMGPLRACANAQREREPKLHGKVTVQFHILPSGETGEVQARGEVPPELAGCLTGVFVAMRFRPHRRDPELVLWPMKY